MRVIAFWTTNPCLKGQCLNLKSLHALAINHHCHPKSLPPTLFIDSPLRDRIWLQLCKLRVARFPQIEHASMLYDPSYCSVRGDSWNPVEILGESILMILDLWRLQQLREYRSRIPHCSKQVFTRRSSYRLRCPVGLNEPSVTSTVNWCFRGKGSLISQRTCASASRRTRWWLFGYFFDDATQNRTDQCVSVLLSAPRFRKGL